MKGYIDDIEKVTEDNNDYRRVLYTGKHLQLVLMAFRKSIICTRCGIITGSEP